MVLDGSETGVLIIFIVKKQSFSYLAQSPNMSSQFSFRILLYIRNLKWSGNKDSNTHSPYLSTQLNEHHQSGGCKCFHDQTRTPCSMPWWWQSGSSELFTEVARHAYSWTPTVWLKDSLVQQKRSSRPCLFRELKGLRKGFQKSFWNRERPHTLTWFFWWKMHTKSKHISECMVGNDCFSKARGWTSKSHGWSTYEP